VRDRPTLAMIVGIPTMQLILFGYAINMDVRNVATAVLDRSQSPLSRKLIGELHRPSGAQPGDEELTEREVEVITLVAQGLSNQEIAQNLGVSERTVTTHVSSILGKLHLANRTQAALYAVHEGLAGDSST